MSDQKFNFLLHPDDERIDEILFVEGSDDDGLATTVDESLERTFLRIVIRDRYKTSGLSGDEWRFATMLEMRRGSQWIDVSGPYRDFKTFACALYPELYGDFESQKKETKHLFKKSVSNICFLWKRQAVYSASYEGNSVNFLVACAHLSWALIMVGEESGFDPFKFLPEVCCQPGCRNASVSVFKVKSKYCQYCGKQGTDFPSASKSVNVRGFCQDHLRRGNCSLEDCDMNYELIRGMKPEQGEPESFKVKPSVYGGTIEMGEQ